MVGRSAAAADLSGSGGDGSSDAQSQSLVVGNCGLSCPQPWGPEPGAI